MTGKVPVQVLYRVAAVAADTRLPATAIHTFATLAAYATEDGTIGVDEDGRSMADWSNVAAKLNAGDSTVRKAFTKLESLGYVKWDRAWSQERGTPIPGAVGQIRIILPDQTQ